MNEQEADGAAQEVQDAGPLHADGEEGVEDGQHQQEHPGAMAQGQNGEQEPGADDGHVPQLPQPQLGLCFQVVGVDKNRKHLQKKGPPQTRQSSKIYVVLEKGFISWIL